MPKGYAINIGLNRVDPAHYHGWDGALKACEADAKDMRELSDGRGFEGRLLLTEEATSENVIAAIREASEQLEAGDVLLLTYSGHGGQVKDLHGEEEDELDETWVLYDRQLIDDELFALWGDFAPGVRIFVLSDSCHSGSVTRQMYEDTLIDDTLDRGFATGPKPAVKSVPPQLRRDVYDDNKELYDSLQADKPAGDQVDVQAAVILISGCQDNQESLDGERNGLFTSKLLEVWGGGAFSGDHPRLRRDIADLLPPYQSPNYFVAGTQNREFEQQTPFTV